MRSKRSKLLLPPGPGPQNKYEVKRDIATGPKYQFGKGPRDNQKIPDYPSPQAYNIPSMLGLYPKPEKSF